MSKATEDLYNIEDISLVKLLLNNVDKWFDAKTKDSTLLIRYDRYPREAIKDYLEEVMEEWK